MKENVYQFYKGKADHYVPLPKSLTGAPQPFPENLIVMLQRFIKVIIFLIVPKNAASCATEFVGLMPGSKIPRSGRWYARRSVKGGRPNLSQVGLRSIIRAFLQAMKPFINGSTGMSAAGAVIWPGLIAADYPEDIPNAIKNCMSPREFRSNSGLNQSLPGDVLVIGRRTP